jgi:hypothetical protein
MKSNLLIALVCLFIPVASSFAEKKEQPAWMKEITRLPPGDYADLRPVQLGYTLAWNNRVNAGEFEISIVRKGESRVRFIGDASGRSKGFARVLWPYDFRARSIVDEDTLRPITFKLNEKERNESSSYDILFEKKRQVYTTTSQKKNEDARSATGRFRFDFGQDVLSSAFYLRSQPLEDGEIISMLVTPFNRPYIARFTVEGREKRKVRGTNYDTIKLDAQIGKVNGDLSIKQYEKVKKTTLWVTNDEYRIPLELQSQIAFGFVSARLDDLNWLE